jgi:hypothetical protein
MTQAASKILFDRRDYALLNIVNDVLSRDRSLAYTKKLYYHFFHSRGIKELAESKGLRIAYAVIHLLYSLEAGKVDDRLNALGALRDEVLNTAYGSLPRNTARVLLQIMKELVRAHPDADRQLELAHDFRAATSGKPHIIRSQLHRYHLLEMPEEWNQVAFDSHVHDANTKGRKSSTHLIMDAWIKGIRQLTVIFYNAVPPRAAAELLEAAEIMDITVRIGIEFSAQFRGKYAQFIWEPKGFNDSQAFLCFLAEPSVVAFMAQGQEVSKYQQSHVLKIFQAFNERHRQAISQACDIPLAPLDRNAFCAFVGSGQASIHHLTRFIHQKVIEALRTRVEQLRDGFEAMSTEQQNKTAAWVETMNAMDIETLIQGYLKPESNPDIANPDIAIDDALQPELLQLSPSELVHRLSQVHSACNITLNLSNLYVEDVLELLYDCNGSINQLEIFNLKDYSEGKTQHIAQINELQRAINEGNAIALKRVIRKVIENLAISDCPDKTDRVEKLAVILHDIETLRSLYKGTAIRAMLGSDSTGRSPRVHGMGLVLKDTLPLKARRDVDRGIDLSRQIVPIHMTALRRVTYVPTVGTNGPISLAVKAIGHLPGCGLLVQRKNQDWVLQAGATRMTDAGNVVTLGGAQTEENNGLFLKAPQTKFRHRKLSWKYLNTGLKNTLKVFIGFVPAFLTFALTKDWWLLAYGGAFIWFGITGLRNILQSVLGGGGFRRSPLLRWNDYVSWDRLTDSLLFSGFSVPLLDWVVKTLILDKMFNITTSSNPGALYTFIALANGVYLFSHNIFRGLPRAAVYGNFFRSVITIPIAIGLNAGIGWLLGAAGVVAINDILQKWATVISKTASECVAGMIEGTADRYQNIRIRQQDFRVKLNQLLNVFSQLELMFPEIDVIEVLETQNQGIDKSNTEAKDLEKLIMVTALDLLYFWMYQPRARSAMGDLLRSLPNEERQILVRSQFVLLRYKDISQLFIDGVVGKNFARPLAFYLDRSQEYLDGLSRMAAPYGVQTIAG